MRNLTFVLTSRVAATTSMGPKSTPSSGAPGRFACMVHTDLATIQGLSVGGRHKEDGLVVSQGNGASRVGMGRWARAQKFLLDTRFWVPRSKTSSSHQNGFIRSNGIPHSVLNPPCSPLLLLTSWLNSGRVLLPTPLSCPTIRARQTPLDLRLQSPSQKTHEVLSGPGPQVCRLYYLSPEQVNHPQVASRPHAGPVVASQAARLCLPLPSTP